MLVARDVRKAFGATIALAAVSFEVRAGEVHALIGENGAGKSTLMNVLAGTFPMDSGDLTLDGAPYRPASPEAARRAGVAMVHQELSLCPHLTVVENIALGAEPARFGFLRGAAERERARAALSRVATDGGGSIPLDARARDLSPAEQQLVEIARALSLSTCRVLVLDEPTSSLAGGDVERLFAVLRSLRGRGVAIVYVSHFLEEVQRIADRFTVLRDGATVRAGAMSGTRLEDVVAAMAGRRVDALFPRSTRVAGEVVLEVDGLAGFVKPSSASLRLHRGEILGIAGLVGAGRTELARAIFGLDPVKRGAVRVHGALAPPSPSASIARGVGFLSEDRKGEGLATALSIADNVTLPALRGRGLLGWVSPAGQRAAARQLMGRLAVRAEDPGQRVGDLSGGNQQKIALARLLYQEADVLLLDEPTRGIDVASKAQIYELFDALARAGKALLVISSYLPELLGVCDRVAVMRRGELGPARPAGELTEQGVLLEATGG